MDGGSDLAYGRNLSSSCEIGSPLADGSGRGTANQQGSPFTPERFRGNPGHTLWQAVGQISGLSHWKTRRWNSPLMIKNAAQIAMDHRRASSSAPEASARQEDEPSVRANAGRLLASLRSGQSFRIMLRAGDWYPVVDALSKKLGAVRVRDLTAKLGAEFHKEVASLAGETGTVSGQAFRFRSQAPSSGPAGRSNAALAPKKAAKEENIFKRSEGQSAESYAAQIQQLALSAVRSCGCEPGDPKTLEYSQAGISALQRTRDLFLTKLHAAALRERPAVEKEIFDTLAGRNGTASEIYTKHYKPIRR